MGRSSTDWREDIRRLCEECMIKENRIKEIIKRTEEADISDDYRTRYNYAHRLFLSLV